MKQAALEAYRASAPCMVVCGEVLSVDPLEIKIDQKLTLVSAQLVLSATVSGNLNVGDSVIMIRQSGGQQFFVIDWRG